MRALVIGLDPNTDSSNQGSGARFRAAGRTEKGCAYLAGARRRQGGGKGTGEDLGTWRRAAATTVAQLSQDKRIAGDGGSRATFSGGGYVALGSPPSPSAEFSERAVVWTKEPAAGEKSGVACPSIQREREGIGRREEEEEEAGEGDRGTLQPLNRLQCQGRGSQGCTVEHSLSRPREE